MCSRTHNTYPITKRHFSHARPLNARSILISSTTVNRLDRRIAHCIGIESKKKETKFRTRASELHKRAIIQRRVHIHTQRARARDFRTICIGENALESRAPKGSSSPRALARLYMLSGRAFHLFHKTRARYIYTRVHVYTCGP